MQGFPSASRLGILATFGIAGGLVVAGLYLYSRSDQPRVADKAESNAIPAARSRLDQQRIEQQSTTEIEQGAATPAQLSDTYTTDKSPPFADDDVTVIEFTVEMRGDTLHGSWKIFFGQDLFRNTPPPDSVEVSMPVFARYEVTVQSESLQYPIVLTYDASAGENIRSMEELASQLPAGMYNVSLFLHVQYVDQSGTNRVLNKSIPALQVELR